MSNKPTAVVKTARKLVNEQNLLLMSDKWKAKIDERQIKIDEWQTKKQF